MTSWLLDTNILSELRRPKADGGSPPSLRPSPLETLFVSDVTLAEIRFGSELVADAGRRRELSDWLTHKVIAATALEHGLTIVSRDRGDFERARVPVFDPWTDT